MRGSLLLLLAVLFTLGGCSSKVVRVAGQSPCKKSFAVISAAREAVDIEYMGSLEIALLSAGCTAYFSKYAIREVELKGNGAVVRSISHSMAWRRATNGMWNSTCAT